MAAGGKAINLGELAIAIALKTGALEQGLKEVQKKLNEHGKKVKDTGKDYDKLALVASLAFWQIASAIGSGVKAFNDFNNSMVGLKSTVQGTGNSFQEAKGFVNDFISDGLIPAADAATALKNLLTRGFELGEAVIILERFKDSAAFGRQASLSLGEAVKSATEGLKNENSILVDNAGVTKNVSVMWKEYAETLGKSINDLTIAEKRQAELNGILKETRFQMGDAAKYANEFAGAQAKNAAVTLKLSQSLGSSMAPVLQTIYSVLNPIISLVATFIDQSPGLVAGVVTAGVAFLGFITIVTAVGAAIKILTPALAALNLSFGGLLLNPIVLGLTALVGILGAVAVEVTKARKAQEAYNDAVAEHNRLIKEGMTVEQTVSQQAKLDELKKLAEEYENASEKIKESQEIIKQQVAEGKTGLINREYSEAASAAQKYKKAIDDTIAKMKELGATEQDYTRIIQEKERALFMAQKTSADEFNSQAKIVAQRQADVLTTQAVIESYKNAEKGSREWLEAEKKLAEAFPQYATMSGIKIEAIEKATQAQADSVKAEWALTQTKIQMTRMELQEVLSAKQKELKSILELQKARELTGSHFGLFSAADTVFLKMQEAINKQIEEINKEIGALKELENIDLKNITGIKPLNFDADFDVYENKALSTALRIHEHRVRMDQLTTEQEIASLEKIMRAYAKTADERMDLEEKIYSLKKELREADLEATQKAIEDEAQKLADRTAFSERWINREKTLGNLTAQDEIDAYNRVIKYHKEYLAKVQADTKIAADEKRRIINEETQYIQDQQERIIQIQKATVEKAVNEYIKAKQKQYDTEEDMENDRLNAKLKALNKEYSDKERALESANRTDDLQSLYEQERRYANAATKEGQDRLAEIRRQIADLKTEEAKESLEAEKEQRKAAIEQEILDNREKYRKLNEELDYEKNAMLASALDFAKKANDSLVEGQSAIANSLTNVMKNFDIQSTNLISNGLDKLKQLIEGYKQIMDNISLVPNFQLAGAGGANVNVSGKSGATVTINDYGDKILSGVDDIQDYGKELVTGAQNAARG